MNEVKVFDSLGNLKKVISVDQLNILAKKQLETPSVFSKKKPEDYLQGQAKGKKP